MPAISCLRAVVFIALVFVSFIHLVVYLCVSQLVVFVVLVSAVSCVQELHLSRYCPFRSWKSPHYYLHPASLIVLSAALPCYIYGGWLIVDLMSLFSLSDAFFNYYISFVSCSMLSPFILCIRCHYSSAIVKTRLRELFSLHVVKNNKLKRCRYRLLSFY